jgi:predicted RNase H-like nuclease (RuvC/YqgF family)
MTTSPLPTETIECPLCSGAGKLKRSEVLDRLGVKDFARVAQLSAEEAFRLLQSKHDHEHQSAWSRFEVELAKRTADVRERHKDELRCAQSERDDLTRRVEGCLREIAQLREKNQLLEGEMSKVARVGKREELSFADEARTWVGIAISDKLPKNGDFILAYRAPNGDPAEPKILIDNKDKSVIVESDIDKLVRTHESAPLALLRWSPARRASFGRLTGNHAGAARTESGCFAPPASGSPATSTY